MKKEEENNSVPNGTESKEEIASPPSTTGKDMSRIEEALGFSFKDLSSWDSFVRLLYRPTDPSSLAVSRILFGLLMIFDIPEERGLGEADIRWGDPDECRFPLFNFLEPLPLHWMCIVYLIMWTGAFGIMLGAFFRISCIAFILPYWYIFLLDKTAWNNHSYLYGILAILFLFSDSHRCWSIDSWRNPSKRNMEIPLWNYAIFRFQLFLLYFYAGLKKTEFDWLTGYSMPALSNHWVFHPFKPFLTIEQIDLWIVHVFGFLLDLTVGFWMYFDKTRPISFFFLICFHLMNSQMFYIGMFPYVCLVTMPLFCSHDWPKYLLRRHNRLKCLTYEEPVKNPSCFYNDSKNEKNPAITKTQNYTIIFLLVHVFLQLFIPYSHFITKGYNNWTNGIYGYSWDMMVHSWDTSLVTVKVVNNKRNETIFIDPEAWVRNNKWQRHADMVVQYSKCLSRNLERLDKLKNISVYIDVWVSLNERFHQRMFDSRVDILNADWGPFSKVTWVMPLLTEFTSWRPTLGKMKTDIHSWSTSSDALFMADFPGFSFQNFIHEDITNVTIYVLEGKISVEVENRDGVDLKSGSIIHVPSGVFHKITTIPDTPSAFVYTFNNLTKLNEPMNPQDSAQPSFFKVFNGLYVKIDNILNSIALVSNAFLRVLYSVPMVRRIRLPDDSEL